MVTPPVRRTTTVMCGADRLLGAAGGRNQCRVGRGLRKPVIHVISHVASAVTGDIPARLARRLNQRLPISRVPGP